ncbi:MAG: AAA family ATPase, partial [Ruminococcus sp.]|nr:AAA family ATPase [Ruminococcus sp.]
MGIYLNQDNILFQEAVNSEIYIDKSMLIECANRKLRTSDKYMCVSRPRRFGKSIAANMLVAYYSKGADSRELFSKLEISKAESFEKHLNKFNVIHLTMTDYYDYTVKEMVEYIEEDIIFDIQTEYPDLMLPKRLNLVKILEIAYAQTKIPFVFIIDEWDSIMRKTMQNEDEQREYLNFLRNLLKDKPYVALAYMTGILPVKKYGEHSALNMFTEYSMEEQRELAEFTGFTESEVTDLCK